MRQATGLGGNFVGVNQTIQSHKNRTDCLHGVGGGIHPDDCVSAPVKQSLECGQKDSANVVGRMIGLDADAQYSTLSHRIAATSDIADFCSGEHQILVAHQFGYSGGNFRDDGPMQLL